MAKKLDDPEEACLGAGIDFSLTERGMKYFLSADEERLIITFPNGPINLVFLPSFPADQKGEFSWSFQLDGNDAVTFAAGTESMIGNGRYLMDSAPYGFRSTNISGGNPKYVTFDSPPNQTFYTITLNFDRKELTLESNRRKSSDLYRVELEGLEGYWPLRVGICGHNTTKIEMKINRFCSVKPAKRG